MIWVPYVDQNCASVDDWWKMILGYAALYQNHECVNLTFQCSDIKKNSQERHKQHERRRCIFWLMVSNVSVRGQVAPLV